ncbi:uncharacterized protein LOC124170643 isoform X2 [Ischnura elegans]|uniref:uncharacterized protein LOC124170643 isoform X2 n=1 Tax=Ischnura elegans TaxID=197161 RepID=UPI001ED8BEB1|nr:uncharacterized protein LOC124170643 isoform X2 [Ischnura elegans]
MGVTTPNPGHHHPQGAMPVASGNGTVASRLDHNMRDDGHSWPERSLCKCCPYGYHIDVDFVRFCEALSGSEGWGDTGKRIRRSKRRERQSMEGLLGLTGPSVWLVEHHLTKIPQEWPGTYVAPDPVGASEMVRDALQQAVIDFEDTLKRSSSKGAPRKSSEDLFAVSIPNQEEPLSENQSCNYMASLQVNTTLPPMPEEILQEEHTKVLTTCTSDGAPLLQNNAYHRISHHDSDGGSVGSNGSAGVNAEALQNIREQMAISLGKMKEMEEKLKLIPILQVQLSILKEEKRKMLLQLKHKSSGPPLHEVRSVADNGTQTTPKDASHGKRDAGVCCSVLTRDVGTCQQPLRLRDVSTSASIPAERHVKTLEISPVQMESIHSANNTKNAIVMTKLSGSTWHFDKEYPEGRQEKAEDTILRQVKDVSTTTNGSLENSLPNFEKSSFLRALDSPPMKPLLIVERRENGIQTDVEYSDGPLKKALVKRDVQVQANLQRPLLTVSQEVQTFKSKLAHAQTQTQGKVFRDMGILAKPSVREVQLVAKPVCKDFTSSCSLISEKDNMSVSLSALGVKNPLDVNASISRSKSTDTLDLVSSSDAAINVCTLESYVPVVNAQIMSDIPIEKASESVLSEKASESFLLEKASESFLLEKASESFVSEKATESFLSEKASKSFLSEKASESVQLEKASEPVLLEKPMSSSVGEPLTPEDEPSEPFHSSKRKAPLLRQDTYTECQVNISTLPPEVEYLNDAESSFISVEKSHYSLLSRPMARKKACPSKEMKAAAKVVNDLLQKQPRSNLKTQLKSATGIIQQEWFTISSTAMADPLDVEDYLDYFEDVSVALLEYVVNLPDNTGNTAMHYAVSHGNFDVVSILLDSKVCDIRRPNQAGYTCVMLVSLAEVRSETDRQVVRRLFQMADVNMRAKQHGQTALMLSVSHGRLDMVQLLLEAGADVNIQDEDGSTALMCAAEHGHADIVRTLLAQPDCDTTIEDNDGSTALNIAMEAGHRNIGVLLYAHEHFQPSSPHGSLKQWRAKSSQSSTPTPAENSS